MDYDVLKILDELISRYPILTTVKDDIYDTFLLLKECYRTNHKILIAGNGGSAADADHIVGELMKGFKEKRKVSEEFSNLLKEVDFEMGCKLADKLQGSLPAIALNNHSALNSAYLNDVDGLLCYAQQVFGYGEKGDVFLGISTSGNSKNIIYAAIVAKAKGMKVVGLTGMAKGELGKITDLLIAVEEQETYKIQELHLPIYHTICLMLEATFYGNIKEEKK